MTETVKTPANLWIEELHQGNLGLRYRVSRTLYVAESPYQRVEIVETAGHGRMLMNNGAVMLSERDEFVYHEMISHVPLFVHPGVERVLVIGGGDGGTVREVIRHPSVRRCRLVEIDGSVVDGCRKHLPLTAAALDDPRVEVRIEDGVEFVERTDERFDLVLVDSTDPVGPAAPLFGGRFYSAVHRVLNDDGIVVSQAESVFCNEDQQRSLLGILSERFQRVQIYNYANLTYPGGWWSFSFACKGDLCPVGDFEPRRVEGSGLTFRYYSPEIHRAAFAHPAFQLENLAGLLSSFK